MCGFPIDNVSVITDSEMQKLEVSSKLSYPYKNELLSQE